MDSSATCMSAATAQSISPARRLQPRLCVSTQASHTALVTPPRSCMPTTPQAMSLWIVTEPQLSDMDKMGKVHSGCKTLCLCADMVQSMRSSGAVNVHRAGKACQHGVLAHPAVLLNFHRVLHVCRGYARRQMIRLPSAAKCPNNIPRTSMHLQRGDDCQHQRAGRVRIACVCHC